MRKYFLALVLVFPEICLASGDPLIVYFAGSASALYVFAAAVLIKKAVSRKIGYSKFILFSLASVISWIWFLNSNGSLISMNALLLLIVPIIFIIYNKANG